MKKIIVLMLLTIPFFTFGQERINVNETICDGWTYKLESTKSIEVDSETYVKEIVLDEFCQQKKSLKVNGELFTGIVYSEYPNGQLKYEMLYKKGTPSKKNSFKYYDEQGNILYSIRIKGRTVYTNNY